jgi:uncharacterized protein (DUF362 family)
MTRIFTQASARLGPLVLEALRAAGGPLRPRRIVLKPNWVLHETDPAFPIRALVTDARLIEAVLDACLQLFPEAESILVGDCPLQYGDWPALCRQSGLDPIIERFTRRSGGRIVFRDLRREVFARVTGTFLAAQETEHGDPRGYRLVSLDARSHLEPISDQAQRFGVNDYSASVTRSNHARGAHQYLVCQSVLDADLFINLPKWKSHAKSGLTGALKNLIGVNGDKAYLPHFRRGAPRWSGDEYGDEHRWLYWAQTTLREKLQKHHRLAYRALKPGWELLKRLRGIETRLDNPRATPRRFYVGGGSWPGNDTLWRTIYDLNLVLQCADAAGRLHTTPQRSYFSFVDGLISGEGNGPLQPLPRDTDWLLCGEDPFALDTALCYFMGFAPDQVPMIARHRQYAGPAWAQFDWPELEVEFDGQRKRLAQCDVNLRFAPPPAWRGYVER